MLGQLITLADDAPGLTDEQLRTRLLALADHAGTAVPHGRRLSQAPVMLPEADRMGQIRADAGQQARRYAM